MSHFFGGHSRCTRQAAQASYESTIRHWNKIKQTPGAREGATARGVHRPRHRSLRDAPPCRERWRATMWSRSITWAEPIESNGQLGGPAERRRRRRPQREVPRSRDESLRVRIPSEPFSRES